MSYRYISGARTISSDDGFQNWTFRIPCYIAFSSTFYKKIDQAIFSLGLRKTRVKLNDSRYLIAH